MSCVYRRKKCIFLGKFKGSLSTHRLGGGETPEGRVLCNRGERTAIQDFFCRESCRRPSRRHPKKQRRRSKKREEEKIRISCGPGHLFYKKGGKLTQKKKKGKVSPPTATPRRRKTSLQTDCREGRDISLSDSLRRSIETR